MFRLLGVCTLALGLLSGCAELQAEWQRQQQGAAQPESERSGEWVAGPLYVPPHAEKEEPRLIDPPLPRRKPEQEPAELATAAGEEDGHDIETLVGLDFDATQALLGKPAFDEVQPPARVWAYNGPGCVLSIFFFPNVDGQSYRALTYEVKGAEGSPERIRSCFAELVQEKEKRGT